MKESGQKGWPGRQPGGGQDWLEEKAEMGFCPTCDLELRKQGRLGSTGAAPGPWDGNRSGHWVFRSVLLACVAGPLMHKEPREC